MNKLNVAIIVLSVASIINTTSIALLFFKHKNPTEVKLISRDKLDIIEHGYNKSTTFHIACAKDGKGVPYLAGASFDINGY